MLYANGVNGFSFRVVVPALLGNCRLIFPGQKAFPMEGIHTTQQTVMNTITNGRRLETWKTAPEVDHWWKFQKSITTAWLRQWPGTVSLAPLTSRTPSSTDLVLRKFNTVWEPSLGWEMSLARALQQLDIVKLVMKLTRLRGLTVATSAREKELHWWVDNTVEMSQKEVLQEGGNAKKAKI